MKNYFPHETIRSGQKEFMEDIEKALINKKHLIAHAPTGIGKTAAVLSVAIPFCLENKKKLIYLIPKQTQHKIAVETIKTITKKFKLNLKVVDFIGKQAMCPNDNINTEYPVVFNIKCKNFRKHSACDYSKNIKPDLIYSDVYHVDDMVDLCTTNEMCPYLTAIKAIQTADIVICDYNHIFTDLLHEKGKIEYNDMVVVFDEAHNLPDRCRDHQSDVLTKNAIQHAIDEVKYDEPTLSRQLEMLLSLFNRKEYTLKDEQINEKIIQQSTFIDDVTSAVSNVFSPDDMTYGNFSYVLASMFDDENAKNNHDKPYLEKLSLFLCGWQSIENATFRLYNEYTEREGKNIKSTRLEYRGLDPSVVVGPITEVVHSVILMSGTLHPMFMYQDLCGFDPEDTMLSEYKSPYPKENKKSLITEYLTSQYTKRGPSMYMDMAATIRAIVESTPGASAVFFTSYSFMNEVVDRLPTFVKNKVLVESRTMTKAEKDRMYQYLSAYGGVLCGVVGGSMSEGYDYKDNVLKSITIVGMPLSPPSIDSNNLVTYYTSRFGKDKGKKYGYIYPCLRSVTQAAGRGIRGPNDKCCIVYMDHRYSWRQYASYFNCVFKMVNKKQIGDVIKGFWNMS